MRDRWMATETSTVRHFTRPFVLRPTYGFRNCSRISLWLGVAPPRPASAEVQALPAGDERNEMTDEPKAAALTEAEIGRLAARAERVVSTRTSDTTAQEGVVWARRFLAALATLDRARARAQSAERERDEMHTEVVRLKEELQRHAEIAVLAAKRG